MLCVLQCIHTVYVSSARSGCNEWEWAMLKYGRNWAFSLIEHVIYSASLLLLLLFFFIYFSGVCWFLHNLPCWK
ncbi:hypothetical protein I7I50_11350 [Histoplasma capsulatum G186AR]|uniref:Uncharacterized protein n=1 Tax=Ajellomyces capsulatus TaxID=5037 RepID=A0A8H8D846_AJECA|nr:hypothetical protein I7I52_02588 [Histoplasma capsulatum]QSS69905.1 hypothetical protein I7I50_11350 [Histoplasma capsulatum G186AR]